MEQFQGPRAEIDLTDLRRRGQRVTRQVIGLLGLAFVTSCFAAFLLVDSSTGRVATGAVLASLAAVVAAVALVIIHRFPDKDSRAVYPPGQLGFLWVATWCLAGMSMGPTFIALTVLMDRI